MGRLPDQHLNLYELTLLASEKLSEGTQLRPSEAERKELEDHLLLCKECRDWFDQERFLFRYVQATSKTEHIETRAGMSYPSAVDGTSCWPTLTY